MKKIPLGGKYANGAVAIVDDCDYERVMQRHWFYVPPDENIGRYSAYAYSRTKTGRLGLHTFIMQPDYGMETDHRNHDGLDNRRENLRNVTTRQNCMNRRKKRGSSCPYKGVHHRPNRQKLYQATITFDGTLCWIGEFRKAEHAALAYDLWATFLHGEFAVTNFNVVSEWTNPKV